MEYSIKDLTEVQIDDIHCSLLIYQAKHFIRKVYQVGEVSLPLGRSLADYSW